MISLQFLTSSFLMFLLFGACGYLLLCADPHSKSIVGKLHRFFFNKMPSLFIKLTGGEDSRISKGIGGVFNYFCYSNHPLVQIFYVLVAGGGYALYYSQGIYPHFPNSMVSWHHHWISFVLATICYYTYYLACKVDPGTITKQNVKEYVKKYEKYYDDIVFVEKNECQTCKIIKPARSKHCKICNVCVSKFDHHCVWIRQCVGEKNYKHFLSFIGMHAILCLYGTYIGVNCFLGIIEDNKLWNSKFRSGNGQYYNATLSVIVKYLFYKETLFIFMVILCAIMGFTLFIFYLYHMSMVRKNVTTNEKIKKGDFMSYQKKQVKTLNKVLMDQVVPQKEAKEIQEKIDQMTKDYELLSRGNPTKGLLGNLKDIYSA